MIHRYDPDMAPDSAFEPGEIAHLVPGNHGRMLDPRRTPMRIVSLALGTAMFECEVLDFEDRGVRWMLPFERIGRFQFSLGSTRASAADVGKYQGLVERFDRLLEIAADPVARRRTIERLAALKREAANWLGAHSAFVAAGCSLDFSSHQGDPRLWADLGGWLAARDLVEIDHHFAAQYVTNPHSGECVKGHRIVLAELGLAPFADSMVRDPDLFAEGWSKAARADHILARLAFVQALYARCCPEAPSLYRGIATSGEPEIRTGAGFVSATFSRAVADSILGPPGTPRQGVIQSQPLPLDRLFMTYHETEQMNRQFHEAEAVLIEAGEFGDS